MIKIDFDTSSSKIKYRIAASNEQDTDFNLIIESKRLFDTERTIKITEEVRVPHNGFAEWKEVDLHFEGIYEYTFAQEPSAAKGEFMAGKRRQMKKKSVRIPLVGRKKVTIVFPLSLKSGDVALEYRMAGCKTIRIPMLYSGDKCSFTIDRKVHASLVFSDEVRRMVNISEINL